ncbi:MAG TPA: amidohydrolase family protein [Dehalococcoidia bacterium]|nr:amidohydrolase family protein [Dehalococcoidia bacterium]
MVDLIVRGGTVVTPSPSQPSVLDVAVEAGRIVAVTSPGLLDGAGTKEIDATGKIVLPGGIEPHAHIQTRVNIEWAGEPNVYTQSVEAASRAAVFGGVTTIVDFAPPQRATEGGPSIVSDVEVRRGDFAGHSYTDFTFHYILVGDVPDPILHGIGEAVEAGIASFKVFTTFGATRVPYGRLADVSAEVARHGGILAVHAEEDEIVTRTRARLIAEGHDEGFNLPLVHSNLSEDVAFRTVIRIARHHGAAVYFVHTTAKEGVDAIAEARAAGLPIYGEALHHYLHFTAEDYRKPEGTAIHTYPAIKSAEDREALTAGLLDGRLSTTATDEYTTSKAIKLSGDTLETVCGGHNGIETRVPVAFTKLVQERGMSLSRFADVIATNAARILGMYPQKGAIAPGSDADLVILDPNLNRTIRLADLHADSDYSIWDGFECRGYPVTTILRGKVVADGGALLGSPGDGEWLARRVDPSVLAAPVV